MIYTYTCCILLARINNANLQRTCTSCIGTGTIHSDKMIFPSIYNRVTHGGEVRGRDRSLIHCYWRSSRALDQEQLHPPHVVHLSPR